MARQIVVKPPSRLPIEQHQVELCEHKGVGHPDTIADAVCEAASRELSLAYERERIPRSLLRGLRANENRASVPCTSRIPCSFCRELQSLRRGQR